MLESEDRALPLSRGQLDIWLSQETGLVGAEWQLGLLVRIEGQVERVLLERAIRQAVAEAEPARAAFFEVNGQIVQRPIDHSDLELAFEDLRDSDDPAGLARKKATDIQRTLMPLTGQLLKFALYRTGDDEFHLFGLCHHINLDGLGMAVVSRRVASIYTALATGEPIPPAYFGTLQDLVDWETDYVASDEYAEDREYWSNNLPPDSGLDYRMPHASEESDGYKPSDSVQMDDVTVSEIKELTRVLRIRRYSVITAACALLVRGWSTSGSEVALDFPVSRRVHPDSRTLPGMMAGVVPLVLNAPPQSTVADFCRHVDTRIRELLQHQRFPVHTLEDEEFGLRGPRHAGNRVAVNFIPARLTLDLAGAPATASYTNHGPMGHFGLFFIGASDQLVLSSSGDGEPFARFGVPNLAVRLQRLLSEMAADPDRRLSSLDSLVDDELAELAELGNRAVLTAPAARPVSIPELFTAQVSADPDAVALTFGGSSLTYRELDEAADRLAIQLGHRGVGPGDRVILFSDRSARAVIGILAVLKTGAAYLPVDPAVPASRLEFIVSDAAPVAAITTTDLRGRLDGFGLAVIDLDAHTDSPAEGQSGLVSAGPAPDDIAYIIYTSGTTGAPKGVAVTHHNVTQLMQSLDAGLPKPGVWPLCHSLAFDVSVWEIWGALLRRRPAGGSSRIDHRFACRFPRSTGRRTGHGPHPDAVRRGDAFARGPGVRRARGGRRGMPGCRCGQVGSRPNDDQRLRTDRDHHVCGDQCAAQGRPARCCGPDRLPGARCGAFCVGHLAAAGTGGCRRRAVCRRRRRRMRIRRPFGSDRITLRGMPVRETGYSHVSHGRPGFVG